MKMIMKHGVGLLNILKTMRILMTMILLSTVEIFQNLVTVHLSGEVIINSHVSYVKNLIFYVVVIMTYSIKFIQTALNIMILLKMILMEIFINQTS